MVNRRKFFPIVGVISSLSITLYFVMRPNEQVDFNSDIRLIINKNCIACHGGVKQNGGLSFLFREDALSNETESGLQAIIPGDPENSEMIKRILHQDADIRMPFEKDPLSEAEYRVNKKVD